MKHQTPDSIKFKRLVRRLGIPAYQVIGILEALWITTQKNAPRGDIGKFDNEAIAIEIGWEKDPEDLIATLVDVGWLDECNENRLVVHDWEDNAPGWVRRLLARLKQSFVTVKNYKTVKSDGLESTPNLTKPNLTKPKEESPPFSDDWAIPARLDSPEVRTALEEFAEMRRKKKKPITSKANTSKVFKHFDDREHLIFAIEHCIVNDYQGLKPEYRPEKKPKSRVANVEELKHTYRPTGMFDE